MAKKKAGKNRSRRSPEQQIADLEVRLEELRARAKAGQAFSPEEVAAERERLELSVSDYADLVGVSPMTIANWEHGRSNPRAGQLEAWVAVKGISKKQAWDQLGIEENDFSAEAVAEERERLELSAADYGELVGVSPLTIYNWEKGKSQPQAKQLERWETVRGIGKRKAWGRLGLV